MRKKLILDTDIGSDIDDAVCLAYLLSQPECDLLGITTVSGEAGLRASIASAVCKAAGRDIPIYPGVEKPLLTPERQPKAQQAKALTRWAHATEFPQGQAIEFIRRAVREHPHEISLLTIGPLTNIGLLFALDPEIPSLLKEIVIMGGIFTNRTAGFGPLEWNILCDPYAAAIVYQAPVPIHKSVGLDVTTQVTLDKEEVRRRFSTVEILKPVYDFALVWFEEAELLTFHDPLAATVLFDPEICVFSRGRVDIELASRRLLGITH